MAAKRSGGGAANQRAKNQAMAQYMKAKGVTRNTCRCPICHHLVSLNSLFSHLSGCKGR